MPFLRELVPPPGVVRVLSLSNLAKTAGHGVIMSVSVLYFTRSVGISADQVGLALSLGAGIGMFASVPAGYLADVFGARRVTIGLLFLLGVFVAGYAFVGDFLGLLVAASLALAAESSTDAARGSLAAALIPPEERVRAFSYVRSIANIGIALGAACGGIALYFDTHAGYVSVLVAGGLMFIGSGFAYLRLPKVAPVRHERGGGTPLVLRDRPFALVALLNVVLVMHITILTVALPVWISSHTSAPTWTYSAALVINTAFVAVLQVRVSRGSEDVTGGAKAMRRAGLLIAACCGLFALAQGQPVWLAVVVVLAGVMVHLFGEMLQGAGQWSLSFGLAPDGAHGQYQGVFAMSVQAGTVITPALATALLTHLEWLGWVVIGSMVLIAGLFTPGAVRWATRTREPVTSAGNAADSSD